MTSLGTRGARASASIGALLATAALGGGCDKGDQLTPDELGRLRTFQLTANLLPPDDSNAFADDTGAARLGKRLFFEPLFGGALGAGNDGVTGGSLGTPGQVGEIACVACHDLDRGGSDHRSRPAATSLGAGYGPRNAPAVINAAFSPLWQFWDGRKDSLWSQALGPIEDPLTDNSSRLRVAHVLADHYGDAFRAVFGPDALPALDDQARFPADGKPGDAAYDQMTADDRAAVDRVFVDFGKAIAAYERRLISLNFAPSAMDLYLAGDESRMEPSQVRGAKLFVGKAGCTECHLGPLLTDNQFHNIGAPQEGDHVPEDDQGRRAGVPLLLADPFTRGSAFSDAPSDDLTGLWPSDPDDQADLAGAFKTPTLRNVAKTAPYMHDGVYGTLLDVVSHYNIGGGTGHYTGERSPTLQPLLLTDGEVADLVEFLEALSDGDPLPTEFPEGLTAPPGP